VPGLEEVEQRQQPFEPPGHHPRRQAAQLANHGDVLESRQMRVEMRFFRHIAEALLPGDEIPPDGFAIEDDFAGGRLDQARDDLNVVDFPEPFGPR
jgi:hypothetical protein